MHKFSSRFLHPKYAVMRHANYSTRGDEVVLIESSVQICKRVIHELATQISEYNVRIYHSPLTRAKLTAKIVHEELEAHGFNVSNVEPLEILKSDSFSLSNDNLKNFCSSELEAFVLFITHLPDIENYLDECFEPAYCTLISRDFIIDGKQ